MPNCEQLQIKVVQMHQWIVKESRSATSVEDLVKLGAQAKCLCEVGFFNEADMTALGYAFRNAWHRLRNEGKITE